jgi:CO dehydrogenase/acetyl-CoA synthase beta subunit
MSTRILTMDVINQVFAEARAKKAKRSYEEMAASEFTGQHIISGQNQLISTSGNATVDKLVRGIQEEKAKIERKVFEAEQPKKTRAKISEDDMDEDLECNMCQDFIICKNCL